MTPTDPSAAAGPPARPLLPHDALLAATRALHESIRERVSWLLERARAAGRPNLAAMPGAWGAGDLTYALDDMADEPLSAYGADLGADRRVTLVAEGPGTSVHGKGPDATALRVLIDPVDGTRSLMHDMRSAWALTAIAPDRGEATRLSDAQVAVQTELPTTSAGIYHVLWAVRGQGAWIARHDVKTGTELERAPLVAAQDLSIDNGYLCFTRYLPVERPVVAELESRFLATLVARHGLSERLLYDDQYLCTAGQLYLVARGRYRMLADVRGWLSRTRGFANFTPKPYDLASLLVWQEAGIPVLDEDFAPLDAPMDTESKLSVIAFANEELRAALEPLLREVLGKGAREGGGPPLGVPGRRRPQP